MTSGLRRGIYRESALIRKEGYPKMALTAEIVENAKPAPKTLKLFDGRGLYLAISPAGGKWWRLKYRFDGKENCLSLGVYPKVSLENARSRRDKYRDLLKNGINPSVCRKQERMDQLAERLRAEAATRFSLDNDGALSFCLGKRCLSLTPNETAELRAFLDATRAVNPEAKHAAD
jgi:hypothetical protein